MCTTRNLPNVMELLTDCALSVGSRSCSFDSVQYGFARPAPDRFVYRTLPAAATTRQLRSFTGIESPGLITVCIAFAVSGSYTVLKNSSVAGVACTFGP